MGGKEIYRPVSILSNFSKVFERLIYNQLNDFIETKFSKFLTGFRKNHNAQNALLRMIENWKMQLNKRNRIGVIVMDLSKTFDTLNAACASRAMLQIDTNVVKSGTHFMNGKDHSWSITKVYPWTPTF